ncbi:aryl-alcohol dehydrogenase [Grosmannia clavigera kw1407]|uniref:Aryl-alcohol dehydrogenase n=1 Tax=Grosmannia clavigera (strain kw1407 / UAMH 11150) TaxID=655863 RepID=F0XI12_GROCL|nr:aryl-alcohol dehydrogenase [Grosmannia clavigera kw1407]EFX02619.1 aryl-alcohol dehydrogenase [Grosmannia clavigera kw1407]
MSVFPTAPEPATELGRLRVLSSTSGLRVSPLALGAMSVGSAWSSVMGSMDKETSFQLLDAFVAAGGNFIDTANNYQNEESEQWLGEWMAARKNRESLVLATKFTSDYRSYAAGPGNVPNSQGNHRRSIRQSVKASLRKLDTDYIDILYLHWWDHTTSIPEIMDTLHALVLDGSVLYLGISDTPAWVVSAANTYAEAHGRTPFSIYQGRWNLIVRDLERDIVPMCRHFGMAIAPWDVLGGGKFQTRKALAERSARGEKLRSLTGGEQTADEAAISLALEKVAAEHGVESTTIALAYIRAKAPRVFPIVGGRKIEHLHDNIKALSIKLTDAQIALLEDVKPFAIGFPNDFIGADPFVTGKPNFRLERSAHMDFSDPLVRR